MEMIRKAMNAFLAVSLSALIIVMTGLVLWQVFTRYVLGNPSVFTEELVRIILLWTSFIGAAYAFGGRQHMALVFLGEYAKGNLKTLIAVAIDVIIFAFALVILIYGGYIATTSVLATKTPILNISKGFMYAPYLISGMLIIIYQVMNIIDDLIQKKEHVTNY